MSNEEKLVYLTNHHWKESSIFIEKAMDKRIEILYKWQYAILSCMLTSNKWKVVDKPLGAGLNLFIVIILLKNKCILIYLPL